LPPPNPLDGQLWGSFPTSWYQDALPDRPYKVVLPPTATAPPVYTPPPMTEPPYGGGTHTSLAAASYSIGSPTFDLVAMRQPVIAGTANASASGFALGRYTIASASGHASGSGVARGS